MKAILISIHSRQIEEVKNFHSLRITYKYISFILPNKKLRSYGRNLWRLMSVEQNS